MKKTLIIALLCLVPTWVPAQNDQTVYLDSLGSETVQGEHYAYRIISDFKKRKDAYSVSEYYKSGKIKSEGTYADNQGKVKEGFYTEYYENGNKKSRVLYTENLAYGDYLSWHENGTHYIEGVQIINNYTEPVESNLKITSAWDADGTQTVVSGNGVLIETDNYSMDKGGINEGYKHGVWEGKVTKGGIERLYYSESYEKGKLVSGTSFSAEGVQFQYTQLNVQAEPKKGLQHFRDFVGNKIRLPNHKLPAGQHRLIGKFIVNKDGKISDIKIIQGMEPSTDRSFANTISEYPAWKPAMQRGRPVRAAFILPITIQILN